MGYIKLDSASFWARVKVICRVVLPGTLWQTTSAPWLILSSSGNCLNHTILVNLFIFVDCVFVCFSIRLILQCTYSLGPLSNGRTTNYWYDMICGYIWHLFLFFLSASLARLFHVILFVRCPRSLWHYAILISSFNNNDNNIRDGDERRDLWARVTWEGTLHITQSQTGRQIHAVRRQLEYCVQTPRLLRDAPSLVNRESGEGAQTT